MKLKSITQSTLIKILIFTLGLLLIGWELAPGIQAANLRAQAACGPNGVGSSAALRAAINQANKPGAAAEIALSPNCIYELDNQFINDPLDGATNLPYLTRDLTVIGNGATLRRPVNTPLYRMLVIEAGVLVTITNVTFENGQEGASGFGGAIRLKQDASLTLKNVNFKNNRARIAGGAIHAAPGRLIINGGLFENNRVEERGGGAIALIGAAVISGAKFIDNQASDAGALLLTGEVTIDHNEFLRNKARSGNGGAVHITRITTDLFLTRNKFFENQAFDGGGAFIRDARSNPLPTLGHVHIYNNLWVNQISSDNDHLSIRLVGNNTNSFSVHYNTFVGTLTPTADSTGVALRQDRSDQAAALPALIFNNIFVGHHIALENTGTLQLALKTNLFFNNRINFQGSFADPLSFIADPLFTNPAGGNFRLSQGSRAINAATDKGIGLDLDGVARPQGGGFDIGAYEFITRNPQDGPGPIPGGRVIYLPMVVK